MKKVAIPSMSNKGLDARVGQHFGRVPYYTVYKPETDDIEILENKSMHAGGSGYPAEILAKEGIDIMVCGGLGRRAISLFEQFGVMVYIGANGTVKDAIQAWKNNELTAATDENACKEHAFRGEGGHKHEHRH